MCLILRLQGIKGDTGPAGPAGEKGDQVFMTQIAKAWLLATNETKMIVLLFCI